MDPGALCRAVESYLCRKNDGHLIRIVGPAFELVCGWAAAGVPQSVVERAIDRTYARYHAKRRRRRPLRIEYCEADVLDLFDEWRRAVGVGAPTAVDGEPEEGAAVLEGALRTAPFRELRDGASAATDEPRGGASAAASELRNRALTSAGEPRDGMIASAGEPARATGSAPRAPRRAATGRKSLAAHLDALAAHLDARQPRPGADATERLLAEAAAAIDEARRGGRTLRGAARRRLTEQLAAFGARLPAAARADADADLVDRLRGEAAGSLEPFRGRMPRAAFATALDAATDRLLAEHFDLPRLTFD